MDEQNDDSLARLIEITATVVSAYVSYNPLPTAGLANLISSVHSSFSELGRAGKPDRKPPRPAVDPKKSVFPSHIISLEDGRSFAMLKRHLRSLDMTPDQYREKWGLPSDYPMVAPNYSATRSAMAKSVGLGNPAPKVAPGKTRARKVTS